MPSALSFDFGTGTMPVVQFDGRRWIRMDHLALFLGAKPAAVLFAARDSSLREKMVGRPDGTTLLPLELVPLSMFVWPTAILAPEHRDGHTAWCTAFIESGACRELGARMASDLGIETFGRG